MDFTLHADQKPATYELRVQGLALCHDLKQRALISYEGVPKHSEEIIEIVSNSIINIQ